MEPHFQMTFDNGETNPEGRIVARDNRRICDNFTEVIATAMHYFERTDKIDLSTCSHKELMDLQDGWLERYRNDALFHAKVESIVGRLMRALDE